MSIYNDEPGLTPILTAAIKEMVEQARALGLTWTLRMATIQSAPTFTVNLTAILDGDTTAISVTNATGTDLRAGDRVYVIMVPPSGNFVIGNTSAIQNNLIAQASSSANSAVVVAETVVLTVPSATYSDGRAYEVLISSDSFSSVGSGTAYSIIRSGSLAGTVLGAAAYTMSPTVGYAENCFARMRLQNNSGADVTVAIVLTLQALGAGSVYTGAGRYIEVRDIGRAADFPDATQIV